MKVFFIKIIQFYQFFISPLLPTSCRYYPTCSAYCVTCFEYDNLFHAFYLSIKRILKCNKFFEGGFDYPIIKVKFKPTNFLFNTKISPKITPIVWFVPYKNGNYFVVKQIKEN